MANCVWSSRIYGVYLNLSLSILKAMANFTNNNADVQIPKDDFCDYFRETIPPHGDVIFGASWK